MTAPEEYETEAGVRRAGARMPYADGRAAGPVGHGIMREARRRPLTPGSPRWGSLPARRGIVVMVSAVSIGVIGTLVAGGAPGAVLGVLLIAGSLAAAFGVHFRQGYLLIPVPALAYAVGATVTGMFHDRGADISHTALAVSAAQWFAGGFLWMTVATLGVVAIAAVRWLARRGEPGPASPMAAPGSRPARSATGMSPGQSDLRR
jgi:hypothetical protein